MAAACASVFVWALDQGHLQAAQYARRLSLLMSVPDEKSAFTKDGDAFWGVMRKAPKGGELDELDEQINRIIAKVRAKVEHPFPDPQAPVRPYRGLPRTGRISSRSSRSATCSLMRTEARSMRRSPPKIGQTAAQAAQTPRKSQEMAPVVLESAFKRQHRRCRKR